MLWVQLVAYQEIKNMTTNRNGTGMTGTGMNEPTSTSGYGSSHVGQNIDQKLDTLKEKAKDLVEQGQEKVDQIKHKVVDVKDQAVARGGAFLDQATMLIKENPLKSVFIA